MSVRKGNIATALVLIVIGIWFLAVELLPQVKSFAYGVGTWPFPIIGIGALFALVGLLTWTPGMMIPACVIAGIGGMLYYQNVSGNWATWSFAWTIIPALVGLGMFIAGIMKQSRRTIVGAGWMLLISLILFTIFGSFLGNINVLGQFWPVLIIIFGIILFARGFVKRPVEKP